MVQNYLQSNHADDQARLVQALHIAVDKKLRRMLQLGPGDMEVSVAVIPLSSRHPIRAALVVLGRRELGGALALEWFSRQHKLTGMEARVLKAICEGERPTEIAQARGVAITTVRSQVISIREKTGARTTRDLVRLVAMLPPLVSSLRMVA